MNGSIIWRRNCLDSADVEMGCSDRIMKDSGIFVEACVCDTPLCNEKMGNLQTTTPNYNSSPHLAVPFLNIIFYCTFISLMSIYMYDMK